MSAQATDRESFLDCLGRSGLLDPECVGRVLAGLPAGACGRAAARALMGAGLLTRFQAERLLAGRSHGFVFGSYVVLDQIGKGGMGRVYKARHRLLDRLAAVKLFSSKVTRTGRAGQLFLREVKATARLSHPNVVAAYDASEFNGRLLFVMEYIDGPRLDTLVREHGPLPVDQACDIVTQAARGLGHAHNMGLIHRDVKAGNLMLQRGLGREPGSPAVVKILDFGLARFVEAAKAVQPIAPLDPDAGHGPLVGTVDYLAPEQARDGDAADARSDLYSLGCVMHLLLTGAVPFPGGTSPEKLRRHASEEPPAVRELRPAVPAGVADVARRLLAKDPDGRFPSAAALIEALDGEAAV